jgi:hypothetical protein
MNVSLAVFASVAVLTTMLAEEAGAGAQDTRDFGPVEGICQASKIAFVTSNTSAWTWSEDFVDIPEMSVTVSVTPARAGETRCLVVSFSAEVWPTEAWLWARVMVRALLDGVEVGSPSGAPPTGGVAFATDHAHSIVDGHPNNVPRPNTFHWVFPNVPAGLHTVTMQFRKIDEWPPLEGPELGPRSLVVQFE